MGHTGNMIIKDFVRQMCVPLENSVYSGDGDSFDSNPGSTHVSYGKANQKNSLVSGTP